MRGHYKSTINPSGWLKFKRLTKPNIDKDVEKLPHNVAGNIKWYNHFEKVWQFLIKLNTYLPYDQEKSKHNVCVETCTRMFRGCFIYNCQN